MARLIKKTGLRIFLYLLFLMIVAHAWVPLVMWPMRYTRKKNIYVKNFYLGPSFSNKEIEIKLKKYQIKYNYIQNVEKHAASEISSGKIVAWFQGQLEFGDRALGNRSILGDPRSKKIKDLINKKIKYREKFRPFALQF